MQWLRVILSVLGLALTAQGAFYFLRPEVVRDVLQLQPLGSTGTVELAVMYGGLPLALGALCLTGAARESATRAVLLALWFIALGAAIPRVALGITLRDFSAYTLTGMVLETGAVLAIGVWFWLLGNRT